MSEPISRTVEDVEKLREAADKLEDRAEAKGADASEEADLIRAICGWLLGERSFEALCADQDLPV